ARYGRTALACPCRSSTEAERLGPGIVSTDRETLLRSNLAGSGARMGKDSNRSERENCREANAAVAINFLGAFRLLIVIEDRRHQNFDQGKENQQCADEEKKVDSRHVRQTRQLSIDGEAVSDECQH